MSFSVFVWVSVWSLLRIVPNILQGETTLVLILWRKNLVSSSFLVFHPRFLSFFFWRFPLSLFQRIFFLFPLNILMFSWFRSSIPSDVSLFQLFIIIRAQFSVPDSISQITCIRVYSSFIYFVKYLDIFYLHLVTFLWLCKRVATRVFLDDIQGSLNKFPDFFRMSSFIDSTHMKL